MISYLLTTELTFYLDHLQQEGPSSIILQKAKQLATLKSLKMERIHPLIVEV